MPLKTDLKDAEFVEKKERAVFNDLFGLVIAVRYKMKSKRNQTLKKSPTSNS